MDTFDARPSPHPGLQGRERSMDALTESVRRLIGLAVTNGAPAAVLDRVVRELAAAADTLDRHVPEVAPGRFHREPADPDGDWVLADWMPYDIVVGRFNPLAPPLALELVPPRAYGSVRFGTAYEGAPGWVHGAAIAAAFDLVLTAANHLENAAGPTVRLALRYRRPTLLAQEARFEAWVEEVRPRRVISRGQLLQDGVVTVEAEGEFASVGATLFTEAPSGD